MLKGLSPQRIKNLSQVEVMREIYNASRRDMETRGLLPNRTQKDQEKWWRSLDHVRTKAWLIYDGNHNIVGFVLLQDRGLFYTPMFAILKNQQGKGYAREFVKFYINKANKPLAGSQLMSNSKICHLNKELGWQILCERGGTELLIHWQDYWHTYRGDKIIAVVDAIKKYHEL